MTPNRSGKVIYYSAAPWSHVVRLITILCSVILIGIALSFWILQPTAEARFIAIVLIFSFVMAYAHSVLGYVVSKDQLTIIRPFFKTRISLADPFDISPAHDIAQSSIRIFGNGGFFSICGWFWHKELGRFRVFLTTSEGEKMQLLKTKGGSFVLVSPETPIKAP